MSPELCSASPAGPGADGLVVITYTPPPYSTSTAVTVAVQDVDWPTATLLGEQFTAVEVE